MKQKCIILRSGSEFWISAETADKLSAQIVGQDKHNFIKIKELDRTINTADIVEILTAEQMDERSRIKNKEFKCQWHKWHARGEKCDCAIEQAKKRRQAEQDKEREESMKPMTLEQEEMVRKSLAENRRILEEKGILTKKFEIKHEPK